MNYPYAPRLDSRREMTGTYDAGSGKTSWVLEFADSTINAAVLSNSFGASAGLIIPLTPTGTTVYATGNYSAGPVILGRDYTMTLQLTRPYRQDPNGQAIEADRLQITQVNVAHRNAGPYRVRAAMARRADRTRVFGPRQNILDVNGVLRCFPNGGAADMILFVENLYARPCTISAAEFQVEVSPLSGL